MCQLGTKGLVGFLLNNSQYYETATLLWFCPKMATYANALFGSIQYTVQYSSSTLLSTHVCLKGEGSTHNHQGTLSGQNT